MQTNVQIEQIMIKIKIIVKKNMDLKKHITKFFQCYTCCSKILIKKLNLFYLKNLIITKTNIFLNHKKVIIL